MLMRPRPLALVAVSASLVLAAGCSATTSGSPSSSADTNKSIGTYASACVKSYSGDLASLPTSYTKPSSANLKIGFLQPLGANETVNYLQKFTDLATKNLGGTFVAYDAEGNPDKQVTQMQQLINANVDAIIVFPLDASALTPVVAQAKKAGIPVIAMEVDPLGGSDIGDFTTQIIEGRDFHAWVQACTMAKLHPKGEVATVKFAVPVPSINAFAELVAKKAEQQGLKVVAKVDNKSDDVAGGETAASGVLAQYPDVKGILAYNDPSAIGAATAARSQSRTITAFGLNGGSDGIAAVKKGTEALTIQFPLKAWGEQLVAAAYDAVADPGTALPKTVFVKGTTVYTADNIDDAQTWEDQYEALTK